MIVRSYSAHRAHTDDHIPSNNEEYTGPVLRPSYRAVLMGFCDIAQCAYRWYRTYRAHDLPLYVALSYRAMSNVPRCAPRAGVRNTAGTAFVSVSPTHNSASKTINSSLPLPGSQATPCFARIAGCPLPPGQLLRRNSRHTAQKKNSWQAQHLRPSLKPPRVKMSKVHRCRKLYFMVYGIGNAQVEEEECVRDASL